MSAICQSFKWQYHKIFMECISALTCEIRNEVAMTISSIMHCHWIYDLYIKSAIETNFYTSWFICFGCISFFREAFSIETRVLTWILAHPSCAVQNFPWPQIHKWLPFFMVRPFSKWKWFSFRFKAQKRWMLMSLGSLLKQTRKTTYFKYFNLKFLLFNKLSLQVLVQVKLSLRVTFFKTEG